MTVITLSREMGSRGDEVAMAVAERLGLRLVGRAIINRAAQDAGAGEAALAELDELGLLGVKPSAASLKRYREKIVEIIAAQAAEGNVLLVGRGGQVVLGQHRNVLHVRVTAPLELRQAMVQEQCKVSTEVAAARVAASDAARASYHKRHFGVRWDDETLYDVILNMARLTVAAAVETVCAAATAQLLDTPDAPAEGCGCES
ncbi:MAG: AAA family ATPase [Nitrososphaerales archaeon]